MLQLTNLNDKYWYGFQKFIKRPVQVITAYYLCLTAEVLGTMVVFMGRRAQLLEKNALRASMVLSARLACFDT